MSGLLTPEVIEKGFPLNVYLSFSSEQPSSEPYADTGSDNGNEKIRYRFMSGHPNQAEYQTANKPAA